MLNRRSLLNGLSALLLLCVAVPAVAQEVVVTGPPPALRKNLDAFQKAFNTGSAAEYEAMAKEVFTAEYLKKQTADQRKAEYTKMHAAFGTIQFNRVNRNGPDAPLEVNVKGSTASGVMWIDLDDVKISGIKAEVAKSVHKAGS